MKPAASIDCIVSRAALAAWVMIAFGCASSAGLRPPSGTAQFDFFATAIPDNDAVDPWYPKVVEWQGRMEREGKRLPASDRSVRAAAQSGKLVTSMSAFRDEERRDFARRVTDWAQRLARRYYKWDPESNDPNFDHWPTVGELLANNGDDCDGLDLIAYQLLREFGFPQDKIYRAIIERNRDKANHMVTLWFENPTDPWVIDPTGAVTFEMRPFSQLEGWTPTKVFNERIQYKAVASGARQPAVANSE
jgi:hypothetical protein